MKLPPLSAKELIAALSKEGFVILRQKGSHVFLRHPDGRTTLIPNHPGEDLDRRLLRKIIRKDIEMEVADFLKLLK